MNIKNKKIIKYAACIIGGLIVGAIFVGVLNGLFGNGEWNFGWTDYHYDDAQYKVGEGTIPAPNVEKIDLDWIDGNVTVVVCQDAYISVSESALTELSENTKVHWHVSEDGKTLSIKYRASSSFFGVNKDKEKDLILRIPEKLMGQLQTLNINAVSSNVKISNIITNNINVKTASGNVNIELPEATAFTLAHETKRGGAPAIDFPVKQEGTSYVSGTDGIHIAVKTVSGKLTVTSSKSK